MAAHNGKQTESKDGGISQIHHLFYAFLKPVESRVQATMNTIGIIGLLAQATR